MPSYALEVPGEYGYVLAVAVSSLFVNTFHASLTVKARRDSGLHYPIAYATEEQAAKDPKAFAFNCAQRAHANYTENITPFLCALFISGLRFPIPAATLGAGWVLARIWYAAGYVSGGPKGRLMGSYIGIISDFVMKFMAVGASYKMLSGA
ncbi:membrane-associated proteins in eicosanoid and glutathione metabolism [Hypoxylon rubiginosum]|uniref:Membrane-associated proteins in eicosanoid and glutathione metabolism n=1 Tax=Hypoxylon rubiginosum TaxID=110542 RepID=A0ACC0DKG8_9PEZI|nr:membrane-associated proteins in eicosanoid and glutathione metabolism [Hypoxylon rubiginosum]